MRPRFQIPEIPEAEKTPIVLELLGMVEQQSRLIEQQAEVIQHLKDEIARLKGQKPRPQIRPSQLEKKSKVRRSRSKKRPGSNKRKKTAKLVIHEVIRIAPESIPSGSTFKGYQRYTVQGIEIKPRNIRYLLELVVQSLLAHLQSGGNLSASVDPELQTKAAQQVGRKYLSELEGLSVHGARLTKLLLALALTLSRCISPEDESE